MTDDLGTRSLHRAWYCLIGFIPSFAVAMLVGEGLVSLFGYSSGEVVPIGVMLAAAVPALLVLVLPAAGAVYLGRRAVALGRSEGRVPAVVAILVAGVAVLQNVLAALIG